MATLPYGAMRGAEMADETGWQRGAAAARLGTTSSAEALNAGLAVLAGADTFGAWLLDQAGTLDPALDVDV